MGIADGIADIVTTPFKVIRDIVTKPIELITQTVADYAHLPLTIGSHFITEDEKNNESKRKIEEKTAPMKAEAEIRKSEEEFKVNLEIKRTTEIQRIQKEIESWQREQEIAHGKAVLDAIQIYNEKLMNSHRELLNALGEMDISLRDKANTLVQKKTKEYLALQNEALEKASDQFDQIQERFKDNEFAKQSLNKAVDTSTAAIINNTSDFIEALKDDIKQLGLTINNLTDKGMDFIQEQVKHTLVLSPGMQNNVLLGNNNQTRMLPNSEK